MPNTTETHVSVPARFVAAVVIGNALEFYDFVTYAFFAVYIGRVFFPSSDPSASLLASLGTFGVGFVMRPIGGFVIGRMGDRLGRKPAMILCFWLMGVAIVGLALTPSYATIGIAAPVLAIFFRILQGFALGGEIGPSTAFLLEVAPPERRGFYGAFQIWSQQFSMLISGLVGFGLANVLNAQQLQDYGWRIAFLLGAAIVPFGLALRRTLPETFHAPEKEKRERIPLRPYWLVALFGLMLLGSSSIGTYIRAYMTTYAIATLHMRANIAFAATVVTGLCGVIFGLVGGALSDRIGRKPLMIVSGGVLLVSILPAFEVISHYRTAATLLGATAVLSSVASFFGSIIVVWLTESLPAGIRSGGLAIVYSVSISVFGGSAQYVVTWLIKATGDPLMPAWYWTASLIIGLAAAIAARETAPCKTATLETPPAALIENVPEIN
jgi:MHS family citrate/tricarballylate:H+ symporter-like MFS transporter